MSITKEKAIELGESHWWEFATQREIAEFQMDAQLMCCPFGVFHKAVEDTLGRPVFTHEFDMDWDGIKAEMAGEKPPPTMEQIINLIPEEKRIIVSKGENP
jgi:hypothetical protein